MTTITKRVTAAASQSITKRNTDMVGFGNSFDHWNSSWKGTWGNSWRHFYAPSSIGLTERVTASATANNTKRV